MTRTAARSTNLDSSTLSLSTVAVAPEASVHVMFGDRPGVHRVGRRQAIAAGLLALSADRLQELIDAVQDMVIGNDTGVRIGVKYEGGLTLKLRDEYLKMQGHELETMVKDAFPELKRFHKQDALLLRIIESVARDHPDALPCEVAEAFRGLLSA